jgi:hypothetical protein
MGALSIWAGPIDRRAWAQKKAPQFSGAGRECRTGGGAEVSSYAATAGLRYRFNTLALLWQIYSRCFSSLIQDRQYGHR